MTRGAQFLKNRINHLITPTQAFGHKTPDLETYFSNSSKIRQQKWWVFEINWQLVIWYASRLDTTSSQKPNLFNDQKHKISRSWYSEITLIDTSRHIDQKLPISREYFWAIFFLWNRNDINNFGPKGQPFKTILTWEEMFQSDKSSMICVVAWSRQTMRMRKTKKQKNKKKKKKLIVMPCTWKIQLSLDKNQEAKKSWENDEKELYKHKSFFSCKELLFSLSNYIWDEKWPSFTIPSLI